MITGPSGLAPRFEINEFIQNEKFVTLFVRALRRCPFTCERVRGWRKRDITGDRLTFLFGGIYRSNAECGRVG